MKAKKEIKQETIKQEIVTDTIHCKTCKLDYPSVEITLHNGGFYCPNKHKVGKIKNNKRIEKK